MSSRLDGARTGLAGVAVMALVFSLFAVFGSSSALADKPTADFTFTFVNGTVFSGSTDPNSSDYIEPDQGGQNVPVDSLGFEDRVIHVSCSDVFTDGYSDEGGDRFPQPSDGAEWRITSYSIVKSNGETCGENFASTDVSISAEPTSGDSPLDVIWTVTESNDGTLSLTNPYVNLDLSSDDDDDGDLAVLNKASASFVGGDTDTDGELDPGETWTWELITSESADVTVIATGHGLLDGQFDITYPLDPAERDTASVTVTPPPPPEVQPGKIIVFKEVTEGSDTSQTFAFTASYDGDGFSLSDSQFNDSGDLEPGTYAVSETVPEGWTLESATCDDQSLHGSIGLAEGETVTCIFTNSEDEDTSTTQPTTATTQATTTTSILGTTITAPPSTLPFTGIESEQLAGVAVMLLSGGLLLTMIGLGRREEI